MTVWQISFIKCLGDCPNIVTSCSLQFSDVKYQLQKWLEKILSSPHSFARSNWRARFLFLSWVLSSVQNIRMPVGLWTRSTAVSTLLTFWPAKTYAWVAFPIRGRKMKATSPQRVKEQNQCITNILIEKYE